MSTSSGPAHRRRARRRPVPRRRPDTAQSTVELALGFPIVVLAALLVLQCAVVAIGHVETVHATREAARAAAVGAPPAEVRRVAHRGTGVAEVTELTIGARGADVRVRVRTRIPTDLPLVGRLLPDTSAVSTVVMRRER